jgi:hypothetical protein
MKYIKLVVPLLLSLCGQSAFSCAEEISINDQQCVFSGPKGSVSYIVNDKVSNVTFSISGKKISAGTYSDDTLLEQGTNIYNNIHSQMNILGKMISGKSMNLPSGGEQTHSGAYLESGEEMSLSAGKALIMKQAIAICGKDALFTTPVIQTNSFFVSAKGSVTFKAPEDASSWLESLTFVASAGTRPFQFMFVGDLNFNPPQTTSFMAIGAQKITFNLKKI